MPKCSDKAVQEITASLDEIRGLLCGVTLNTESIKKDVEEIKQSRKASVERVNEKLGRMLRSLSALDFLVKGLTTPNLFDTFHVRHPEHIDTTPQDMYDELTAAAQEIQGEVDARCEAFGKKMLELTSGRDSTQFLADCVALLKEMQCEIVSRRERIESLKLRRRNADKDSNEQKNAAILTVKIRSMIEPLEKFTEFVLDSYFAKRKRMLAEIWRTTVAIEEMYDETSKEFKEKIPSASDTHRISSALKNLLDITTRHEETHRANELVRVGSMSALERRKILAGLKTSKH